MFDLKMLGLYLLIALAIHLTLGRLKAFRRLLGSRQLDEKPAAKDQNAKLVEILADSGTGLPHDSLYGRHAFSTPWGVRLVTLSLSSLVVYMLGESALADLRSGMSPGQRYWFLLVIGAYLYVNLFVFLYEVVLFDGQLTNMGYRFGRKTFEMRDLVSAEDDGNGSYRLEFTNRRVTFVLKYVKGREILHEALLSAAKTNANSSSETMHRLQTGVGK